jgi:hypothetical protein
MPKSTRVHYIYRESVFLPYALIYGKGVQMYLCNVILQYVANMAYYRHNYTYIDNTQIYRQK